MAFWFTFKLSVYCRCFIAMSESDFLFHNKQFDNAIDENVFGKKEDVID